MRTIVAAAIAGGIAAAVALVTAMLLPPATPPIDNNNNNSIGGSGGENSTTAPIQRVGGLPGYNQTIVEIGGVRLLADIADTSQKKGLGLGVRDNMTETEAMLFPMEVEAQHGFWMNGMKFPIDIVWLGSDKKVVHIEENLQPCPNVLDCKTYTPDRNALYVLETVAGFTERHNVTVGMQAEFELGQ